MEKCKYADMLPHEIVARRQRFPAAFIGLGGAESLRPDRRWDDPQSQGPDGQSITRGRLTGTGRA